MPGYKDWIDTIDIKIDYYSAFMKAWIAFNAWYNYSGEIEGKNDKEHIDAIAQTSNRFREYIVNLLGVESSEGVSYRDNVANLHEALQNSPLMTQEYIGTRQAISFSNVATKNLNTAERFDHYRNHYECVRTRGKIITSVKVKDTGVEIFHFEQDEYDKEALQQQGFSLEERPFRPHITLARRVDAEEIQLQIPYLNIPVTSISLMQSEQRQGRLIYTELSRASL